MSNEKEEDYQSRASKLLNEKNVKKQDGSTRFPKSVFFIIGNEFCERFSYYGFRAVLTLYLKNILSYNDHETIEMFHGFVFICYFTPVFGAILADGFIGKFNTILSISVVYAIGNVVLAIAGIGPLHLPTQALSIIGLLLIAIGTGGIKPCVSAFGGDQFESGQTKQLEKFFSIFYFAINAGSVLSMFVTPRLRADISCFGRSDCYPLAFGVPSILMVVSLILFVVGKPWYKISPAQGTVITDFISCTYHGVKGKIFSKEKKAHWLDHAKIKFDMEFIESTKAVFRILVLFIPIPFFWALFDQLGSRWLIQATHMNGRIANTSFYILPDQIGVLNPILILVFIPLFEEGVYPLLSKCNLLVRPLQRMCVGGFLAAIAYVIAGFLQLKIEATAVQLPETGFSQVRLINSLPCEISVTSEFLSKRLLAEQAFLTSQDIETKTYNISIDGSKCATAPDDAIFTSTLKSGKVSSLIVGLNYSDSPPSFILFEDEDMMKKSDSGQSLVSVSYMMPFDLGTSNFTFGDTEISLNECHEKNQTNLSGDKIVEDCSSGYGSSEFIDIPLGEKKIKLKVGGQMSKVLDEQFLGTGSIIRFVAVCRNCSKPDDIKILNYTIVTENSLHMAWQIPQYVIITAAEILISITGLQFSYTQAPEAMKSVLSAAWLLNVSFGNCIVLIIELIGSLPKPSQDLFLYAGLMAVDMIIFAFIAYNYKYVNLDDESEDQKKVKETTSL